LTQPELFREFNEYLIWKICKKYKLNFENITRIFILEDEKTMPEIGRRFAEEIAGDSGIYFLRGETFEGKKLVNAGWRSGGREVWIEKGSNGGAVIFHSKAPQEDVIKDFLSLIRQNAKIKGSQKIIKRIKEITGINLEQAVIDEDGARAISAQINFIPLVSGKNDVKPVSRKKTFGSGETSSILSAA
jgi:hypothetical protein